MDVKAKARWSVLHGKRSGVLMRARQASAITIPSILPPEGHAEDAKLPTPYQSLGARGVNNLASKMLLALFPSTTSFFRLKLDDSIIEALGKAQADVEDSMRVLENRGLLRIEQGNLRIKIFAALKHMIVTGNALLYMPTSGNNRMYRLSQFCVMRDAAGNVTEILIRETASRETLDQATLDACDLSDEKIKEKGTGDQQDVEIFTWVVLKDKKHVWHQEINEILVPGSEGRKSVEDSPFIVMRWSAVENEDYGRGLVEEYLGDFISLEGLSKSIIQFAAAASKIVLLLHPNSLTDEDELAKAESGDIVTGSAEDVDILQLEKSADFQAAKAVHDEISLRLSHAFLLQSGTVRDAERVTAEEIRSQAQELEDVLGGVYTVQAVELQLPVVRRTISQMEADNDFPKFPKNIGGKSRKPITPTIVTGFEALGRGHELNRLRAFFQDIKEMFGENAVSEWVKEDTGIKTVATSHNVDVKDLLRSPEEVSQSREASRQAELVQSAAAPVAGQVAKGMVAEQTQ